MSIELTPEERAELRRRIDCPVPWCAGRWLEHGGDGQPPERWLHQDEDCIEIGEGALLSRAQEATGAVVWSLSFESDDTLNFDDPGRFAGRLRELADAVLMVATGERP